MVHCHAHDRIDGRVDRTTVYILVAVVAQLRRARDLPTNFATNRDARVHVLLNPLALRAALARFLWPVRR